MEISKTEVLHQLRKHWRLAIVILLSLAFLIANIVLFSAGRSRGLIILNTFLLPPIALAVTFYAFRTIHFMPKDNPNHSLWSGLAWGWALWTVAEFWWVILFHSGSEAPYPSGADLFWMLGYIPIFASFGLRIRSLPVVLTPAKKNLSWLLGILILAFTGYAILWPVVRSLNADNLVRSFFDLFYPLADLALLLLVLRFFFTVPEGIYGQARLWVAIGYALRVVSDLFSSHLSGISLYYPQGLANASSVFMVDLPYFASYVCFLVGLLILYRMKQSYSSFIKAESHPQD